MSSSRIGEVRNAGFGRAAHGCVSARAANLRRAFARPAACHARQADAQRKTQSTHAGHAYVSTFIRMRNRMYLGEGVCVLDSPNHPPTVIPVRVTGIHRAARAELVLFYALTARTAVLCTAAPPRGRPFGRGACALGVPCSEAWCCCLGLSKPPTHCHPGACHREPSRGRGRAGVVLCAHGAYRRAAHGRVSAGAAYDIGCSRCRHQ